MSEDSKILSKLNDKQRIEILRKNWMSQDSKCQMAIVKEFGWEKGNKLNKKIIKEMGKVMMFRLMNALNIKQVLNISDLMDLCYCAMNFYYPPPTFSYYFKIESETSALGVVKQCGIMEGINQLGIADKYECGCFSMRSGWYQALGIEVKETCLSCIKNRDIECRIEVKVNRWSKSI